MFGITSDLKIISGDAYHFYRIQQVFTTQLGSLPFNRGYGANIEFLDANVTEELQHEIKTECLRVFEQPANALMDLTLNDVSIERVGALVAVNITFTTSENKKMDMIL